MEKQQTVETCYFCGNTTLMNIVGVHKFKDKMLDYDDESGQSYIMLEEETTWRMNDCPVCKNVTLTKEYSNSDMEKAWGRGNSEKVVLFPTATFSFEGIPDGIKNAFEAALKVRNLDNSICLVALRRTLESICEDKGATGKNLYLKIKDLSDKSILPPILNDISDVLREFGNEAAHATTVKHSKTEVELMVEFTEAIINYVYVLPIKLSKIQSKMPMKK